MEGYELRRVPVRAAGPDSVFDELGCPRIDLLKIDVTAQVCRFRSDR